MQTGLYVHGASKPFAASFRVVPQQQVNRVVNRLLDGSAHVQIIGTPQRRFDVEAILDDAGRLVFETLSASGGLITLVDISATYVGRIVEEQPLERVAVVGSKRWVRVRFVLAEEVVE